MESQFMLNVLYHAGKLAAKAAEAGYEAHKTRQAVAAVERSAASEAQSLREAEDAAALVDARQLVQDYPERGTFEDFQAAARLVLAADEDKRLLEEARTGRLQSELAEAQMLISLSRTQTVDPLALKYADALCAHHAADQTPA